jgi:hypothetical protein
MQSNCRGIDNGERDDGFESAAIASSLKAATKIRLVHWGCQYIAKCLALM